MVTGAPLGKRGERSLANRDAQDCRSNPHKEKVTYREGFPLVGKERGSEPLIREPAGRKKN